MKIDMEAILAEAAEGLDPAYKKSAPALRKANDALRIAVDFAQAAAMEAAEALAPERARLAGLAQEAKNARSDLSNRAFELEQEKAKLGSELEEMKARHLIQISHWENSWRDMKNELRKERAKRGFKEAWRRLVPLVSQ